MSRRFTESVVEEAALARFDSWTVKHAIAPVEPDCERIQSETAA